MTLFLASLGWLSLLFALARLAESRRWLRLSSHPAVYALSLGVYATSWTYFGAVGLARTRGLSFLAVSLGPMLACLLVGAIWLPVLRLVRRHQLATLADLFAYRYRSQTLGVLVTVTLLVGVIPYLAVQVRAVAHSALVLMPAASALSIAAIFCGVMLMFAMLFGARHATTRERHPGLVVAMAFESAFKVLALCAVGFVAYQLLPAGTSFQPQKLEPLLGAAQGSNFASVCLVAMGITFLLPREFHMAFAEAPETQQGERGLKMAAWLFPALLLVMNIPIPFVLWAGQQLAPEGNADLYVLTVASQVSWLQPIAWLGGVSASSAMVIVETLALSSMALTHLVLPWRRPEGNVYVGLVTARRGVLALLLLLAFAVFVGLERVSPAATARGGSLAQVGLVSFAAVIQCLPGFLGVLFFPRATRAGVTAGLLVGVATWLALLAAPLVGATLFALPATINGGDTYGFSVLLALTLNAVTTTLVSMKTLRSPAEARAAAACRSEVSPGLMAGLPTSVDELVDRVSSVLGRDAAELEVSRTLGELALGPAEKTPRRARTTGCPARSEPHRLDRPGVEPRRAVARIIGRRRSRAAARRTGSPARATDRRRRNEWRPVCRRRAAGLAAQRVRFAAGRRRGHRRPRRRGVVEPRAREAHPPQRERDGGATAQRPGPRNRASRCRPTGCAPSHWAPGK